MTLTDEQAKYFAHELSLSYSNDHVGRLAGLLFDAQVDPKPHQIEAALFALSSPFLRGVILADEVGLGKTIEAGIVITQFWAERKRRILIVAPSSLRQQWQQELQEKFFLSSSILDSRNKDQILSNRNGHSSGIVICSYEFALRHELSLARQWDLVVADEAHRLRNYWTGKAKIAAAVSHLMSNATKSLLLTATPLQNRLEELYGLVSVFEPGYFSSLSAFRERYVKKPAAFGDDDLAERVELLAKRTLRQDVDLYIQFTKRLPLTVEFEPSEAEQELYKRVNALLQREELFAFSGSQRHLGALILRKRLGSSTFAVASTLEHIAARLRDLAAVSGGQTLSEPSNSTMVEDEDLTGEELEELSVAEFGPGLSFDRDERAQLVNEADEFAYCANLARAISSNAKGERLLSALDMGFERLASIEAAEKAVVFTDSTKTQDYLHSVLLESGRFEDEDIVLFNGTNNSAKSTGIYNEWKARNADSDLITGIPAADRRKALVDHFRDRGKVLIATEAAAEGINLQFCSMVVNYDLPWNPQRVEQRIGRCHRYGQRHNVVVVNFSNQGNVAEQRILELLETKFHLFASVFGASDEILGSIESGIDVERAIGQILDQCTTADEIDRAFEELSETFADTINDEMKRVRERVFDSLDPHVQDRLKTQEEKSEAALNRFEEVFLRLTRHELDSVASFSSSGRAFELHTSPDGTIPVGRYHFKTEPVDRSHQYRFASDLGQHVIKTASSRQLVEREIVFDISASPRVTAPIRELRGKSGYLAVHRANFALKAHEQDIGESYLVAGAVTSDGEILDGEIVRDLMDLVAVEREVRNSLGDFPPATALEPYLKEQVQALTTEVQERNAKYYDQQEDMLYRQAQDRRAESEARIREFRNKEAEARKQARQANDPVEQLKHKREARKWGQKADSEEDNARSSRQQFREQEADVLDLLEKSLKGEVQTTPVVSFPWRVVTPGSNPAS